MGSKQVVQMPLPAPAQRRVIGVQVNVLFQDPNPEGKYGAVQQAQGMVPEADFDTTIGTVAAAVLRGASSAGNPVSPRKARRRR